MRALLVLPLIAAVALSGCKKEAVVAKDESVEAVAKKVTAAGIKPQPGRWESTMKFEKMDMPNLPPQAREAMTKQLGATRKIESCLTPEQVNAPGGGLVQGAAEDCKYDHFVMADGKVDSAMTCKQQGATFKMTMAGTYSETSYDIRVTSAGEMQPGNPMTMEMAINSRRVGDCTGKEDK